MRKSAAAALAAITAGVFATGCLSINVSDVNLETDAPSQPSAMLGTWKVSLRYDPEAAPSQTEMRITRVENGTLEGTFYGSPIEDGRYTRQDGVWVIAGRTADGTGAYWHSARLDGSGSFEGQTLSAARSFLMTWEANKN
jgi:hypothetical protein